MRGAACEMIIPLGSSPRAKDIAFGEAVVIGDSRRDMEAGRRLGERLNRIARATAPDELCCGSIADAVDRYVLASDREQD